MTVAKFRLGVESEGYPEQWSHMPVSPLHIRFNTLPLVLTTVFQYDIAIPYFGGTPAAANEAFVGVPSTGRKLVVAVQTNQAINLELQISAEGTAQFARFGPVINIPATGGLFDFIHTEPLAGRLIRGQALSVAVGAVATFAITLNSF